MNLASSISCLSKTMINNISKLHDDEKRNRKSEEFYSLMNLIDSLEDKIQNLGGNLNEVYEKFEASKKEIVDVTSTDIKILNHVFWDKEYLNWFKEYAMYSKKSPLSMFYSFLEKAYLGFYVQNEICLILKFSEKIVEVPTEQEGLDLYILNFPLSSNGSCIESDCGLIRITKEDDGKVFFEFNGKKLPVKNNFEDVRTYDTLEMFIRTCAKDLTIECDVETKLELIEFLKRSYIEDNILPSAENVQNYKEIENVISEINCDIILSNLRNLYAELLSTYKELKFKKR